MPKKEFLFSRDCAIVQKEKQHQKRRLELAQLKEENFGTHMMLDLFVVAFAEVCYLIMFNVAALPEQFLRCRIVRVY
jgi:hypothetical protein